MNTLTLSLSLLLLGSGFSSVASAQTRRTKVAAPILKLQSVSPALKSYIHQVQAATDHLHALGLESGLKNVLNHIPTRSSTSPQTQPAAEDEDIIDLSSPTGQKLLKILAQAQAATHPFRKFNPVPHSATKVDAQFVQFSLKAQEGLELFKLFLSSQDDDALLDKTLKKLEEAKAAESLAAQELIALKQTVEAQAVHKTYVPG